jgi:putative spermidine/putrescine transport system substrate-binding protein
MISRILAFGVVLSTISISTAHSQDFKGVTLRVGTYGGGWKDAVNELVSKKLEAKGVKIEYVLGNPAENLAKVIAAHGQGQPIDVMEIGPAERVLMLGGDMLADIPANAITNMAKLPAKAVEPKLVPHIIVQNGIVYRADVFEKEKIKPPETYGGLANASLTNRVAFPDVTNTQFWTAAASLAYEGGGNETTPKIAIAEIEKIKPLYYFSAATELAQKFSLGDVVAAPWHAGWAIRLERSGMKVGFINPVVGDRRGAIEYNYLGILKGSKNVEAAAAFIDAFLDTNAQAEFARIVGVVPTNRDARQKLADDPLLGKIMLLSDSDLEKAFIVDWAKIDQPQWRSDWTRAMTK